MSVTSLTSDLLNWYKVSVWDWKANNYNGAWIISHVSVRTKSKAQTIVDDNARQGKVARWSRHIGGSYHYASI